MRNEKNLMSENIAALGSWVSQGWDATKYLKLWGCDIQEIVEICRLYLSVEYCLGMQQNCLLMGEDVLPYAHAFGNICA